MLKKEKEQLYFNKDILFICCGFKKTFMDLRVMFLLNEI